MVIDRESSIVYVSIKPFLQPAKSCAAAIKPYRPGLSYVDANQTSSDMFDTGNFESKLSPSRGSISFVIYSP